MYFPSLFACCVLLSAPGLLFPFLPSRPGNLSFFLYSYILFQHLFLSRSSLTLALLLLSYSLLPSLSIYLLLLHTVSPSPSLIFYCLSSSLSSFLTFPISLSIFYPLNTCLYLYSSFSNLLYPFSSPVSLPISSFYHIIVSLAFNFLSLESLSISIVIFIYPSLVFSFHPLPLFLSSYVSLLSHYPVSLNSLPFESFQPSFPHSVSPLLFFSPLRFF